MTEEKWIKEFEQHPDWVCQIYGNISSTVKSQKIIIDSEEVDIDCCENCYEDNQASNGRK